MRLALAVARHRDAAEHELGIETVAAFLEVAAIGHLRDQIARADQVTELAIAVIVEADLIELHFVAGEVHDLGRDRHPLGHADRRQVAADELRAAADVAERELGAVAMRLVVGLTNVAGVVEQRGDDAEDGALRAEALVGKMRAVVADDQPRDGERAVERMLQIVIDGVATVVAGKLAVEQPLEIAKRGLDAIERIVRPGLAEQVTDGASNGISRTDLHGVRDVEIAAPILHFVVGSRREQPRATPRSLATRRRLSMSEKLPVGSRCSDVFRGNSRGNLPCGAGGRTPSNVCRRP